MNEETRIALLEQTIIHIDNSLSESRSDIKIFREKVEEKLDKIEQRFNRIEEKMYDNFLWTMCVVITLFSGLYATALGGMIARMCRWI